MKKFLASVAIAAIAAVPFAGIAGEEDATVPANEITGAEIYVDIETGGLYQESNGLEGLQTSATDNGDEDPTPADSKLA